MKYLTLLVVCLCITVQLTAQEQESRIPEYSSKLMIGSSLNSTYGSGLSFAYVQDKHGISLNFLPFSSVTTDDLFPSEIRYLNLGLSYNYYIRKNNIVDFSLKTGFQRISGSLSSDVIGEPNSVVRYSFGVGPEISFHLSKEIDFSVNLGYGLYNITESLNSNISGGVGFYYNAYLK